VGLERVPFSLVGINEELLERKVASQVIIGNSVNTSVRIHLQRLASYMLHSSRMRLANSGVSFLYGNCAPRVSTIIQN
jgi:hypothetical protein